MKKLLLALSVISCLGILTLKAQCVPQSPSTPVTLSRLGRTITYSNVSINGGGNTANVAPGASFTVSFNFSVSTNITACPGCVTYIYYGVAGTTGPASPSATTYPNTQCMGSVFGGQNGSSNATFTAPLTPGYYYITDGGTWTYWCYQFTVNHSYCLSRAIGLIVVGNPVFGANVVSITDASGCGTADGSADIDVTGAPGCLSYQWNDTAGTTTQDLDSVPAGNYQVLYSFGGCVDSLQVSINQPSISFALGADTSICQGESLPLDAGSGLASYNWSTGATSQTISASTAGQYFVDVTDTNGCTGSDTLNLAINPNPVINLGGNDTLCAGNSVMLDAGAGFASYLWQDGSTGQTLNSGSAGNYSVIVTDTFGCQGADTMALTVNPLPAPNLPDTISICAGGSTRLDPGTFAGYTWQDGSTIPPWLPIRLARIG